MSVCSYFPKRPALRLRGGDVPAREAEGQVLDGSFSVEEALAGAARRAWRAGEAYATVAHYDPVLRSHCRLDEKEGEL